MERPTAHAPCQHGLSHRLRCLLHRPLHLGTHPGLRGGLKPAGIPCVHLLDDYRCALFGLPERSAVCLNLRPTNEMCGAHRDEAMARLNALELATRPSRVSRHPLKTSPPRGSAQHVT